MSGGVSATATATVKAAESSAGASRDACTSKMLLELQHKFEGRSPRVGIPDGRISDPQVVADHLVQAWMRHDTTAAGQLTRDGAPIESLFSHRAPSAAPTPIPCRLFSLGRFACS